MLNFIMSIITCQISGDFRRKSAGSRNGFIYKNNLAVMQAESPYEIKSVKSEPSQRSAPHEKMSQKSVNSRPNSPGSVSHRSIASGSDIDVTNGKNPFESNDEEE